ncbi:TIGR00341 family protein [Syntrophus gentianae]|uniref:TIGR00341 family protein n=1 Tax=Syntrophus gentianae TaxID=43775 RepID=A0A1H7VT04_9BACT|nr:TIGR00341 family protein [Syntrophus gentianae]SEM12403.1 TIGR00341 family protein [Syntrophus gentianae]
MDIRFLKKMGIMINRWLSDKLPAINHKEIIKDIYDDVGITAGYFTILAVAGLVALCGLMINSTPVIIGAMLISPLMGPILSFGFAFITGDSFVWKNSIRKIIISVLLTVLISAMASYISPLNEVTREIATRTTPNIFDLLIAFLSGTAGAAAICTKKNYLTIVPGVAIATAVIPPLSVAGFGIGTGNIPVATGAFFLFFTNFVAIVLSTGLVFYLYGFRPSLTADDDIKKLKRRLFFLFFVLLLISIPLIYTLSKGVSEIKLRKDIEKTLKQQFNQEKRSRLVAFHFSELEGGMLEINANVNTVNYINEIYLNQTEQKISNKLKRRVKLNVEQVKVMPKGLIAQGIKTKSVAVPPRPSEEIFQETRGSINPLIRRVSAKAEEIISPSRIMDFAVVFQDKAALISLQLKIKRDYPLSREELTWLEKFFSTSLNIPVHLSVETVPFVPNLFFDSESVSLTEAMKKNLEPIKDAFERNDRISIYLETVAEAGVPYKERIRLANERASVIAGFLITEYRIPPSQIRKNIAAKAVRIPSVKILIHATPEKG